MRIILLVTLVTYCFLLTATRSNGDPVPSDKLCEKYNQLYLTALHESLKCSEDYGPPPHLEEECEKLSRKVRDLSRLRSLYCYGEEEETC